MSTINAESIAKRQDTAAQCHQLGFNCAQSVAHALADLADLDQDVLFCLMEGFGGGMGAHADTCGALSGAVAVLGAAASGGMEAHNTKCATYPIVAQVGDEFRQHVGSSICCTIKGETPENPTVLLSCNDCIDVAVELACKIYNERLA